MPKFHFSDFYFLCKVWGIIKELLNAFKKNVLPSTKQKTCRAASHLKDSTALKSYSS